MHNHKLFKNYLMFARKLYIERVQILRMYI